MNPEAILTDYETLRARVVHILEKCGGIKFRDDYPNDAGKARMRVHICIYAGDVKCAWSELESDYDGGYIPDDRNYSFPASLIASSDDEVEAHFRRVAEDAEAARKRAHEEYLRRAQEDERATYERLKAKYG